ncbi:hypothetical protein V5799_008332 [Amblyomma americanum]|uniref:SHSP domain-containing protein n=1 Tax=Amblyomma americanum TaxID=6943 RepID=A0AAQ4FER2_AMBAM
MPRVLPRWLVGKSQTAGQLCSKLRRPGAAPAAAASAAAAPLPQRQPTPAQERWPGTPRQRPQPLFCRALSRCVSTPLQFKVVLDVRQFNPEDLTVKTCGKHAVIQAVRTEDRGRKGIIVKEFTRRYLLPDGADCERVSCSLTEDGFLTVDVPMKDPPLVENERVVPITVIHGSSGAGQPVGQSLASGQQPCQEYKKNQTYRRPSRLSLHSTDDIG